ncbi:MAG: hypothetical protein AABX02_03635, partial [archaeon]
KQTGGHFWIMVVLFLLLSIIGGLIQGIESFLPVIDAEWLVLIIGVTLTSLSMFYSIIVLSTALPHPETIHLGSPRKHGRAR